METRGQRNCQRQIRMEMDYQRQAEIRIEEERQAETGKEIASERGRS